MFKLIFAPTTAAKGIAKMTYFFIFLGEILAKSSTKIQAICHCRAFLNAANVVAKLLRNDVFSLFLTT